MVTEAPTWIVPAESTIRFAATDGNKLIPLSGGTRQSATWAPDGEYTLTRLASRFNRYTFRLGAIATEMSGPYSPGPCPPRPNDRMYLPVVSYCRSRGILWSKMRIDPSRVARIPEIRPNTYSAGPSSFPNVRS